MTSTSLVRSRYAREWRDQPPRRTGGFVRYALAVALGAGAVLAWQYDHQVRDSLADAFPQLGWLASSHAAASHAAEAYPAAGAATESAALRSADHQQVQELAAGFAALRERVDQLSQQLATLQTPPRAGPGGASEPQRQVEQTGSPAAGVLPRHFVAVSSPTTASAAPVGTAMDQSGDTATAPAAPPQPPLTERVIPVSATVSHGEVCKHDAARLARLRMTQDRDEVAVFENTLGCEELRPQVLRLRESIDPR